MSPMHKGHSGTSQPGDSVWCVFLVSEWTALNEWDPLDIIQRWITFEDIPMLNI